jgi:hypothetical protein
MLSNLMSTVAGRTGVVLLAGITCLDSCASPWLLSLKVAPAQFVCSVVTAWRSVHMCLSSVLHAARQRAAYTPGRAAIFLLGLGDKVVCRSPVLWLRLWVCVHCGWCGRECLADCSGLLASLVSTAYSVAVGGPPRGWYPVGVIGRRAQAVRWWAWVSRRCCAMGSCHVNECRSATVVHPLTVIGRTVSKINAHGPLS